MTDTVVVVGPELAGATAVAEALRRRLDGCAVVERFGPGPAPDAVVFVTSAAAPMSDCDTALLAEAAARTDTVVAAVTKIDVHRTWPAVLEANRARPHRCRAWVGVAADPAIGPPVIAPLVDAVRAALDDENRRRRNALRARQWTLERRIAEHRRESARRAQAVRRSAVRMQVRQARIHLAGEARARSAALRADVQREAAAVSRRGLDSFGDRVRHRAQQAVEDVDDAVARRVAEIAARAGVAVPARPAPTPVRAFPPPRRAGLEDRLAAVLGTGFGLGVALTLGRFLAQIAPAATPAVAALCGAAGVGLAAWVVRARRLVLARAAMERWAAELATGVQNMLEERVLAAESALLAACVDAAAATPPASAAAAGGAVAEWIGELAQVHAELRKNPN